MSLRAVQQILPPAQLPPCTAPALQPEPHTAANSAGSMGLAQTVQDVFSCSAFVTSASQLPSCVMDNYAFEVQVQREIQVLD